MIIGVEKSGKILENCNVDLETTDTVDYPCIVNFLAVHNTKHLKFRVQILESHSYRRIHCVGNFSV